MVAGDSGGPLPGPGGVIGMDTAGNNAGYQQQAARFGIPVNTALSVASQIAAGRASSAVVIGYPPFLGVFVGTGSDSSPQDQAQQGQQQNARLGRQPGMLRQQRRAGRAHGHRARLLRRPGRRDNLRRPGRQAGLTGGAVITAINGQPIGSPDDFGNVLAPFHPGDTISITSVSPAGQRTTSSIRLTAGPPQ